MLSNGRIAERSRLDFVVGVDEWLAFEVLDWFVLLGHARR